MAGLDDHADALGSGAIKDRLRYLLRELLLDLEALGVDIDQAGDLREPDYLPRRDVTDMTPPEEREEMVEWIVRQ